MNIGIMGLGGVGGYFGGKICKRASMPDRIFFIARGKHLDAIRKQGLHVSTATEGQWVCSPTVATDRIEELPILDVCLLCTKSYDLNHAVSQLCERVSEATVIVPLLNGVDRHVLDTTWFQNPHCSNSFNAPSRWVPGQ